MSKKGKVSGVIPKNGNPQEHPNSEAQKMRKQYLESVEFFPQKQDARINKIQGLIQAEFEDTETSQETKLRNSKLVLEEIANLLAETVLSGILSRENLIESVFHKIQQIVNELQAPSKEEQELKNYIQLVAEEKFKEHELYFLGNEGKILEHMLKVFFLLSDRIINYTPEEPTN
ncbi:MAG: hypothetical protein ACRBFS_19330 [Aureispira sp.]